ncbi:hypothetical protein ADK66_04760 [Micromonospora sp. NRRL B-16802]|nr:hypothetical protein ADK66_04760 [Micromonospora sp. NRRL B-16802]
MTRASMRIGSALIASVLAVTGLSLAASPASAQPSGLTFYSGAFTTEVANFPAAPIACAALPLTADSHIGWSGFRDVIFYRTTDCTGQATGVGTLRTYEAGRWLSFRAF